MHTAPLLKGLIPRSTFVTWPRSASSFGGKLSSVTIFGDGKGAKRFCWRDERISLFLSGASWTDLFLSVLHRESVLCCICKDQAVILILFLVTMAETWSQCLPSSTCHLMQLSSLHPIRCIYLYKKGLSMSNITNMRWEFLKTLHLFTNHQHIPWVCQHSEHVCVSGTALTSHHFPSG